MKKIEAVIKPAIMDEVYAGLGSACRPTDKTGHHERPDRTKRYRTGFAMTVTTVEGVRTWRRRTAKENIALPGTRIDVVGKDWDVRAVVDLIEEAARTGTVGGHRVFMTRARIDLFVSDEHGEKLIDAFCSAALNGKKGDGKIFAYPLENGGPNRTKKRELVAQGIG